MWLFFVAAACSSDLQDLRDDLQGHCKVLALGPLKYQGRPCMPQPSPFRSILAVQYLPIMNGQAGGQYLPIMIGDADVCCCGFCGSPCYRVVIAITRANLTGPSSSILALTRLEILLHATCRYRIAPLTRICTFFYHWDQQCSFSYVVLKLYVSVKI